MNRRWFSKHDGKFVRRPAVRTPITGWKRMERAIDVLPRTAQRVFLTKRRRRRGRQHERTV
jgi:hypothetical protein